MIDVAICDDDVIMTGSFEEQLFLMGKRNMIEIDSDVYWDGKELADAVFSGKRYDLIFLDIEMKEEDGIKTAKRIREFDKNVLIVYVTSYENYMKDVFEVRPFRFLLKPLDEQKLEKCLLEAYEEVIACDYYFRYRYERINRKIMIGDIYYFESKKRKLYINTLDTQVELYRKMSDVEKELRCSKIPFLRIHQSYLVNYRHIYGQAYDYIIMDNNKMLPISEDRRVKIRDQYCLLGDGITVE